MEAKTKDLWVFVETKEDGSAKNVGIELLNPGRELANQQGGKLVAVIVGNNLDAAINEASAAGADQVIAVEGPEYADYTTDAYVTAMAHLIEKYGPTTMLIGATPNGRDMGPRLSSRLQTGLTADCTALAIDEATGCVAWTRPAFGGNLMATILCADHRPQLGTVRPGVFKKPAAGEAKAEVIREDFHVPAEAIRTEVLEVIREAAEEMVDLEGADIIVSGGRGVGSAEGFDVIRELADRAGRNGWRIPRSGRRGLDRPLPSGRPDRQDRRPQAVHRLRYLGRNPASGWHELLRRRRRDQQGSGRTNLWRCRLRRCGQSV